MPMGVVSDDDFQLELERLNKQPAKSNAQIIEQKRGRGQGNTEVPDSLKQIIGETHLEEGRQAALEISRAFGVSDSSESAYANGATSTASYNQPKKKLVSHLDKIRSKIQKRAGTKLAAALDAITDEKLEASKAMELSAIARNMAAVVKDMEPEQTQKNNPDGPGQFIIYAPMFIKEESYQVLQVND